MQNPRLAARYAKSLLDLAIEQKSLDATLEDMKLLDRICTVSREFKNMLHSPVINSDKKIAIINKVLKENVSPLTKSFVDLLIKKNREANLDEMAAAFIEQYKVMKNIRTIHLTTAVPMDEKIKNHILNKVAASMPGDTLEIETHIDPELIGGFIIETDDKLLDASVRRDLNNIRSTFIDYSYTNRLS